MACFIKEECSRCVLTKEKVEIKTKEKKTAKSVSTNPIKAGENFVAPQKSTFNTDKNKNSEIISTINKFNSLKTRDRFYGTGINNPVTVNKVISGNEIAQAICASLASFNRSKW